jgi:hypothetical protein
MMCCVRYDLVLAFFSTRYIFRRLSPFFVLRLCRQILSTKRFSSTFNKPSAKPTRVRALGTNQRSRARLI